MGKKRRKPTVPLSKKLKRSTSRNDLNGADNNEYNDEPSSDSNSNSVKVFLLEPESSLTPAEKVFFIDHIIESIFSELDKKTLINCRLVCRRSEYFATKALQNVVKIKFKRSDQYCEGNIFYSQWNRKLTIAALVDLMNNSREFPCTSFTFWNYDDAATFALEPFFSADASRVEKLKLNGSFSLHDLKQLIFTLTLNVREMTLGDVNAELSDESSTEEDDTDGEEQSRGKDQTHLDSTLTGRRPGPVWNTLKKFVCEDPVPEIIIRRILESSPNLAQVSLHQKNLHCLVKPKNCLHLVKKLVIDIDPNCDVEFNSLELVAKNHGNNWAVEKFEFSGFADDEDEELQQKLLDILHNILQGCSATCTKLVLKTILENFKTPAMPCVKHLTFPYQRSFVTRQARNIFPQGASLSDTFPSLRSLYITSRQPMVNVPIGNIFGGGHHLSVLNVKDVELQFHRSDDKLEQSFQEMFPKATIRNTDTSGF